MYEQCLVEREPGRAQEFLFHGRSFAALGPLPIIEQAESRIITPATQRLLDANIALAQEELDEATENLQWTLTLNKHSPARSEAFIIRPNATGDLAHKAGEVACKSLWRSFAQKDGNFENEVVGDYDATSDTLILTTTFDTETGLLVPTGGLHAKRQKEGGVLPVFKEIRNTWKQDPLKVLSKNGRQNLWGNPNVMEVVTAATLPGYDRVAGPILYNLVCLEAENAGIENFVAAFDQEPAAMLNKSGMGFMPLRGLAPQNYHAERVPGANLTTIYTCNIAIWKSLMTAGYLRRYWSDNNATFKRFTVNYLN